jgi:leucyl aminopeptidase
VSTPAGYQSPTVAVAITLPKRGAGSTVLVVGVVSADPDNGGTPTLLANLFLDAEATGGSRWRWRHWAPRAAPTRSPALAPSLPVASVLAVGLGKLRDAWPADVIRRAAGARRALGGTEAVVTTLSDVDVEATVEGLILGAYRFTDFRSDKTAPKDKGLRKITALSQARDAKKLAERGATIATAVATARFVNTPPSHLFPAEFAERAKASARTSA